MDMYPAAATDLPEIALEELLSGDGPGAGLPEGQLMHKLRTLPESAATRAENRDRFRALVTVN